MYIQGVDTDRDRRSRVNLLMRAYREDDSKWPQKNKDGRQELEIRLGSEHISFEVWCIPLYLMGLHTNQFTSADRQNRLSRRCHRIPRPRGPAGFLLSRPRPKGIGVFSNSASLQDQTHLRDFEYGKELRCFGVMSSISKKENGYHRVRNAILVKGGAFCFATLPVSVRLPFST